MKSLDEMTEAELRPFFDGVCARIKASLPPQTGFILLATPMGETRGIAQYAGNVRRDDAAKWMQETLDRWKAGDVATRVEG